MNERIGQLAEEARLLGPSSRIGNSHEAAERFAELIIEECIDCIRGAGLTDEAAERNNLGFNDGISAAVINTQKHFGVD